MPSKLGSVPIDVDIILEIMVGDEMESTVLYDEANQLKRMKEIYRFIKDENVKTDDSVLTIIGGNFHDENAISNYLAYVLDPQLNGVGTQPLNNFLKILDASIELSETDRIDIQREYTLPNNRRIDFLITINEERMIAIEHKVFSDEHGDQTWDYERELNELFRDEAGDMIYVFLTPNGRQALNPAFDSMSYEQLVFALKNVDVNFIADIRIAVLYNEMIFHLEGYFLNDKKIALSNKATLYIEHEEMIQDLKTQFKQDYEKVFQYIESVIKNYFSNNLEGEWKFDFSKKRGFHQIYKPHWKEKGLNIHFELNLKSKSLINHEISFLLDIEGTKKRDFTEVHDKRLKDKLENVMNENDILYRKGKRADTFAIKTYHFLTPENLNDEEVFNDHLVDMIEDFRDFIDVVDREIDCFRNHTKSAKNTAENAIKS